MSEISPLVRLVDDDDAFRESQKQIGRASCRERV